MNLSWELREPPGAGPPGIPTSLSQREALALNLLATGKTVLEIGSAYGFSTISMAVVAESVWSIDHHEFLGTLDAFLDNLNAYKVRHRVHVIQADSRDMKLPRIFDLCFIDGDHKHSAVENDCRLALASVKPGGHIACHDYGECSCPQVTPVVDKFLGKYERRLVDTLMIVKV